MEQVYGITPPAATKVGCGADRMKKGEQAKNDRGSAITSFRLRRVRGLRRRVS